MLELDTSDAVRGVLASLLGPAQGLSLEVIGSMQHTSQWADIVAKAKRLIGSGNVSIINNGPTFILAHVIGDHGEYECEISRTDPSSSIIQMWSCTCPWNQFAFDRTRKWKKLEGRVCSHVLAAYWKGKSTPLDEGSYDPNDPTTHPNFQRKAPRSEEEDAAHQEGLDRYRDFQRDQYAPGEQIPITEDAADKGILTDLPRTFGPDDQYNMKGPSQAELWQRAMDKAKGQPLPSQQDIALPTPPVNPYSLPKAKPAPRQRGQLQLFDNAPVVVDQATAPAFSQPGKNDGMPGHLPGTYSRAVPFIVVHSSEFRYAGNEFEEWATDAIRKGRATVQLRNPVFLEQSGGKIPMPGVQPIGTTPEGIEQYRTRDLGWHPELEQRIPANGHPDFPGGAPERTGIMSEVARGRRGEIVDIEPMLKMVFVHIPLNHSGPLHPHLMKGWVGYDDVIPLPDAGTPFRKSR